MSAEFRPEAYRAMTIDGYEVTDGRFVGTYTLRGVDPADDVTFSEVVDFGAVLAERPDDRLLRLLTVTCSLSYYKAAAPPRIEIAFPTFDFEKDYLRQLIVGGLGEFAYRNSLPEALTPDVIGPEADEPADAADDDWDGDCAPLVPVGGGKDSVVTIEALRRHGFHPILFSVNKFAPIDRCIDVSGLNSLRVTRKIDRRLIEVNAAGAHNGHVPVTAINSIIGLIVADAKGLGPVVFSNEKSSNVGNVSWMGRDVNHQWSKSIEYESLMRNVLSGFGLNPDRYFSLLRGLSESEIADRFRDCPRYFRAFISCNRPFALDPERRAASWCGNCPKCLFVFALMAPRLGRTEVEAIFDRNLFVDNDNRAGFEDVAGLGEHKPFECVGEYYEAAESLLAVLDDAEWGGLPMVEAFRSRRSEIEAVAVKPDDGAEVEYVPKRYKAALDSPG